MHAIFLDLFQKFQKKKNKEKKRKECWSKNIEWCRKNHRKTSLSCTNLMYAMHSYKFWGGRKSEPYLATVLLGSKDKRGATSSETRKDCDWGLFCGAGFWFGVKSEKVYGSPRRPCALRSFSNLLGLSHNVYTIFNAHNGITPAITLTRHTIAVEEENENCSIIGTKWEGLWYRVIINVDTETTIWQTFMLQIFLFSKLLIFYQFIIKNSTSWFSCMCLWPK